MERDKLVRNPKRPPYDCPLPPYGRLDADFTERLRVRPVVPPDWQAEPGCDGPCRLAEWEQFKADTLLLIAKVLWPVFNPDTQTWMGASAANMRRLTQTDLQVLTDIQSRPVQPLDVIPNSPARSLHCPTHRRFFQEEDDDSKAFLDLYSFYDRTLDDKTVQALPDACGDGLHRKVSSASLQFKLHFQRPRAYQTSFMLGFNNFENQPAASSMTPSLSSGHCLQGVLGVGTIMERVILLRLPFSEDSWAALEQHAVDIGDRRVMAGVHYPSDNIASWIIAFRMAPKVFRSPEVAKHLWRAVSKRSFVYQELVAKAKMPAGKLYRKPLAVLESAVGPARSRPKSS
jgi:hypothetical protein